MSNDMDTFVSSLKEMIDHCENIQKSLVSDKNDFTINKFTNIDDSNRYKTMLLEQVNQLSTDLRKNAVLLPYQGSLLEALKQHANNIAENSQQEFTQLVTEFEIQITKCYEALAINNKIIYSNLDRLQDIWEQFMSCKPSASFVYDSKGKTGK